MEYPINIEINLRDREKFTGKHGYDFPEYL